MLRPHRDGMARFERVLNPHERAAKGPFGFHQPGGQLAAKAEIPVLGKRLGLLQSRLLGAGTVLLTFYRCRAMPGETPAPVNIDLPSKDSWVAIPVPCFVSVFDMGTGNHANKDASNEGPVLC